MTEISHEQTQALVSKAWDGELSKEEEHQLVSHFAVCTACREAAEGMAMFLARFERVTRTMSPDLEG